MSLAEPVVAFVFARGGSRGLPRKNLARIGDASLLGWAIRHARAVSRIDRVVVSTDDPEIAQEALDYGAQVPALRPAELAADHTPEWQAWRHALEVLAPDARTFVSVPTTTPLRRPADIDACLELHATGRFDLVLAVTPASRSPYFNMVTVAGDGHANLVCPLEGALHRRQDAPQVHDVTTACYVTSREHVLRASAVFEGRVGGVQIPAERAVDIDTLIDLKLARLLHEELSDADS